MWEPWEVSHALLNCINIRSVKMPNFPFVRRRGRYSEIYFTVYYLMVNLKKVEYHCQGQDWAGLLQQEG